MGSTWSGKAFLHLGKLFAIFSISSLATAATEITSAPLSEYLIYPEFSAPATTHSLNDSRLSSEIMARIDTIAVRVGDLVEKGDLLVELDCRNYRSQLDSQLSLLKELDSQQRLSASQLARARSLKKQRNISDEQVEQRETDLAVIKAKRAFQQQRVVQYRLQTEHCLITAPFSGVVRERISNQGELASPGTPLLRLQQLSALEVSAQLRPDQLPAPTAKLYFFYLNKKYPMKLRRLLPVVDTQMRTQDARFEFSAESAPAGAAGRLVWQSTTAYLPASLLVQRKQEGKSLLGVMLQDENRARFQPMPDAIEGQPAKVDFATNAKLIFDGRLIVNDGDAIAIKANPKEQKVETN
ncbi:efflux RND transporter periplasmic adaptor subunit [Motiliproteus sp. MSK22-1]|uniref:efflux RND transporter periplasmic adaptor subunit n=1 Tax=Motiliproteus sp. MSK22-1 TaxID=1897630 RepID=UPI0009774CE8|nr:efflux RND transporter periplasmic adaptor subunit [Motiliproteus sp. MSK22-1]OMH39771.1 hypothetical protein BGP75_01580 [Motiliproteus sp. MSK22-1]